MNPEDTANLIPRGRRIIYFHAGYVGGYHSALYALPETKCAIAVLSNSSGCGDCVEWIAQLLLAIVCGDEIDPTTLLLLSEKQKDRDRLQWSQIESALLETSSGAAGEDLFGMTYSEDSTVAGHYYNEKFGITVEIWQQGRSKTTCFISFQPQEPRQAMVLKHWRGSIWSFFPTEEEYHLRVMKHLSRWSKFLLHLEVSANHSKPSGFWWQYDHSIDGIWFSRLENYIYIKADITKTKRRLKADPSCAENKTGKENSARPAKEGIGNTGTACEQWRLTAIIPSLQRRRRSYKYPSEARIPQVACNVNGTFALGINPLYVIIGVKKSLHQSECLFFSHDVTVFEY
ncbi:hypothetical protein BDW59DRAFT_160293 [Aspergillus cavernicola]|uniref:Beta-lactamase-related domain-containing protein n=1 Tax=Aspergillus cavernicola TaxID=176166 RepID=A0ABR4IHT6_9EURO